MECRNVLDRNTQILWDKIVERKNYKMVDSISISRQQLKYPIRDVYKTLRGRKIKIRLWVEFMPVFGLITRVSNSFYIRMSIMSGKSRHLRNTVTQRNNK